MYFAATIVIASCDGIDFVVRFECRCREGIHGRSYTGLLPYWSNGDTGTTAVAAGLALPFALGLAFPFALALPLALGLAAGAAESCEWE